MRATDAVLLMVIVMLFVKTGLTYKQPIISQILSVSFKSKTGVSAETVVVLIITEKSNLMWGLFYDLVWPFL